MTILQINAVGQYGSTGRTCKELSDYINNHTAHTCYTAFAEGVEDRYSLQIGSRCSRKLHALLSRLTGRQACFSYFSTKKFLKKIDEIKPDVVHLRNLHANFINLRLLLNYLVQHKIPVVVTLHDCWFFTGKCCHYSRIGCDRWLYGCGDCKQLRKDNIAYIDSTAKLWKQKKILFESIPDLYVVGVSNWIANEAKKSFLSCAKSILRIYNWVDIHKFSSAKKTDLRQQLCIERGQKVVLGVASGWGEAKGLNHFFQLADELGESYQVVLVGSLPSDSILPSNIIHVKETNSVEELASFYSMADVFVTLSLEESFGKVSLEALACGAPVVCYDSTANSELVGPGCGTVVPPEDGIQGIKRAIIEICRKGRSTFCEAAHDFVVRNFKKEDLIESYLSLYEQLLGDN